MDSAERSIHTHTSNAEDPHEYSREPCNQAAEVTEGPSSSSSCKPFEDEASEKPSSLHSTKHPACDEASDDPSFLTTVESCRGPSSHSLTELRHGALKGPSSSNTRNEASTSSSNLAATVSLAIHACDTVKRSPNDKNCRKLQEHVLEWSVDNIMDDTFLERKVKEIPLEFESLFDYFASFEGPLLEEVRAQIKQSLELIHDAPYARLAQIKELERSPSETLKIFQVHVKHDHLRNRRRQDGTLFKCKPKDLLLLSSKSPGSLQLGGCFKGNTIMAFVNYIKDGDNFPSVLKILVLQSHKEKLEDNRKTWFATFLVGLATSCRIWSVLNTADIKKPIFGIIEKTLKFHDDQSATRQDETPSTQWLKQNIESYCSGWLNESQTSAVVTTLSDVKSSGLWMIQGPPGTGKTSTAVALLSVAASLDMKCLVTCPTNTSVAEVASRYLKMLEHPENLQFGGFYKSAAEITVTCKSCKVLEKRDVLLVGSEDKLPQGKLKEIYLPSRVESIQRAITHWRSVTLRLATCIEASEMKYQEQQTKEDANASRPTCLLELVTSNLQNLLRELKECGNFLIQALPTDQTVKFSETAKLSETLLNSILESAVCEQDFPEWFLSNEFRVELAKQLRTSLSMERDPLFSKAAIQKLCIKSSSVIFCTVSAAGRFCVKSAAPFDCLIIDEAAQLVEAETAIAACLPNLTRAILVGDHKQLPATVRSKLAAKSGYGRSLFERMISLKRPCHLLNIQYRMHPSISLFPNTKFYEGCLLNGENVRGPSYRLHEDLLYGSYALM